MDRISLDLSDTDSDFWDTFSDAEKDSPSFPQSGTSHIQSNSSFENVENGQIHGTLGFCFNSESSSSINRNGYAMSRFTSLSASSSEFGYQAALQNLHQPKVEATLPDGLMTVPLLRHQKIALYWMLQKESPITRCKGGILADDQGLGKTISIIALIQVQRSLQLKPKPRDQQDQKIEALNLDDDDEIDSYDSEERKLRGVYNNVHVTPKTTYLQAMPRKPTAGTLIVCPASVLSQWAGELRNRVTHKAKLSILIYHGNSRTKSSIQLAKYDVVLTTYSIVSIEVPREGENCGPDSGFSSDKKRKTTSNNSKRGKKGRKGIDTSSFVSDDCGTLARVIWTRVILDEAQVIKNHRTQVAISCCGLRAKSRWCLSGTPIQNSIDDLYSYFRFLKCEPYCVYTSFCNSIKNFIARNPAIGYLKLQDILNRYMLRRTKATIIDGVPIIKLPSKSISLTRVDFSTEERAFYLKLEAESRSKFKAFAAAGTVNQNYANILLMLLRLRQACSHPRLVKGVNMDPIGKFSSEMAKRLPNDMLVNLSSLLETSMAICCVCNDPPEDSVVTMCGHVFCFQCVSIYLTGEDNMCPAPDCKAQLGSDVVFSGSTLRSCMSGNINTSSSNSTHASDNSILPRDEYCSSKINAALRILHSHCKPTGSTSSSLCEAPEKTIIFSQWTGMLDMVETALNQFCIQYRRFDGTMTLIARDRSVKEFNTYPEVSVMLMSLKAGGLGLNMVAASHVILMDIWWNPTAEDQAIDRTHRIGQTRPVTVSRITIKNTVEDRILDLQEKKRKMVASAFGENKIGGSGSTSKLTKDDFTYLFA